MIRLIKAELKKLVHKKSFLIVTIIFVLLGVSASTLGKLITANIIYLNIIFGIITIIFGMHYMGILNIKILIDFYIHYFV